MSLLKKIFPGAVTAVLSSLVFLFGVSVAAAQNFSNGYFFSLPVTDTLSLQSLPVFPRQAIGSGGFVSIDPSGHFSVEGERIRFFGTNCVADGAFPPKDQAWFVAGRLRKMGFNLVRFHLMDNPWSANGSIFVQGQDTRHLNSSSLDRLDSYLNELKSNGIYADINLHVGRTFRVSDGVPDADSLQEYAKGYTFFDPILIALQKEYARQLLTHPNPYTGHALVDDPVMAMVEITNENSLYKIWRENRLKPYAAGGILPVRHQRLLDSLWHAYLVERYGTTTTLAASWSAGASVPGTEGIVNGSYELEPFPGNWSLEQHSPAAAAVTRVVNDVHSGFLAAKLSVTSADGLDWHVQWKYVGLSILQDSVYEVRFAAHADSLRAVTVTIVQDTSPWAWYAGTTFTLDTTWQEYSFVFRAPATRKNDVRISFGAGISKGMYWFDDISFKRAGVTGLLSGESLEINPPRRIEFRECSGYTDGRVRDMTRFIMKIQSDFYRDMKSFLVDSLHVRVPIVGTNWNFGAPDLAVQSGLDYIDNHSYWDHPQFPSVPWSSTDWLITNAPMVKQADGAAIGQLMQGAAVVGKPYTISEYNHPFPNRYQSEAPLFLASYGAYQDADALMLYDYNSGADWTSDFISGYFETYRNTAQMSLIPSVAFAFRNGFIAAAKKTFGLELTADDVFLTPKRDNGNWQAWTVVPPALPLVEGVRTTTFEAPVSNLSQVPPAPAPPYLSDTKELLWDPAGLFTVASPQFVGITGFLQNFSGATAGDLTLIDGSDHATLTWISLTGRSLPESKQSLITLSTKVQNTGMVWDGISTIHNAWGSAPTEMYPVLVHLKLHLRADSLHLAPLTQLGGIGMVTRTILPADTNTFFLDLDQSIDHTPWYGINAFGQGVVSGVSPSGGQPLRFELEQNYPNPFNPSTVVSGQLTVDSKVKLVIYDVLGRLVATLIDRELHAGKFSYTFDARALSSGVYFYRLEAGGNVMVKKMTLLK
ncbi:MAG: carbohydrate binding domain-containing protein [Bacteroidota bacterium]